MPFPVVLDVLMNSNWGLFKEGIIKLKRLLFLYLLFQNSEIAILYFYIMWMFPFFLLLILLCSFFLFNLQILQSRWVLYLPYSLDNLPFEPRLSLSDILQRFLLDLPFSISRLIFLLDFALLLRLSTNPCPQLHIKSSLFAVLNFFQVVFQELKSLFCVVNHFLRFPIFRFLKYHIILKVLKLGGIKQYFFFCLHGSQTMLHQYLNLLLEALNLNHINMI